MEQKKTLWIVAATGIFLLVVCGAALILYSPSLQNREPVQTYYNPAEGWVNEPKAPAQTPIAPIGSNTAAPLPVQPENSGVPAPVPAGIAPLPPKVENVTVISDNTIVYGSGTTTTFDLNALKSNPAAAASVAPKEQTPVKPAVTESQYTPAPDSYYAPPPKAKTPAPKKEAAPAKKPAPKAAPAKTTAKPAAKTTAKAKTPAPKKEAGPKSFWIQVGSYAALQSANEARGILENNKIPNEVFTYKDAKGKVFYRVRVGPYTTKSEAEYWQKRIGSINEFGKTNSFIAEN